MRREKDHADRTFRVSFCRSSPSAESCRGIVALIASRLFRHYRRRSVRLAADFQAISRDSVLQRRQRRRSFHWAYLPNSALIASQKLLGPVSFTMLDFSAFSPFFFVREFGFFWGGLAEAGLFRCPNP